MDDTSKQEQFENKIKEAIDLATQKSASGRTKALETLNQCFSVRYVPELVDNQQVTTFTHPLEIKFRD